MSSSGARRVLVTGGAGFVGANLVRRLLKEGHEVHAPLRPGTEAWRLADVRADVRTHELDLGDEERVRRLVAAARPEWVFHLAAHGGYATQTDLGRMLRANVLGTVHLLQACAGSGFEAFVNTGSSSEYGFKELPPSETTWIDPNSHYAVTKAAATLFCRYTGSHQGLPVVTLRLYSVFGPFEEPTRLLPTLIRHGLRGELPPLASPEIARDFVYTEDVLDAYLLAAREAARVPGAVYNVGSGVQTTLREVVDVARRELAIAAEPRWSSMADRRWDTSVWVADNSRIQDELGWRPRNDFAQGFRRTVQWFRERSELGELYDRMPQPVT